MSKKSKRRKHRKLSTSSSEDDQESSTTSETTKRKRAPPSSKVKNDDTVQRTKEDHSSSKDEGQSKRKIKKPVSRLEKTKSTRGESPIFKNEKSRKSKTPENNHQSVKDHSAKRSSRISQDKPKADKRDILVPRSVSVAHKVDRQNETTRKSRWDVLPTSSVKTTEGKNVYLVSKDALIPKKNEPTKQTQPQHGQEYLKTKLKHKIIAVATSTKTTTGKEINIKTTAKVLPYVQRKTLKESTIAPPQSRLKKNVVAEKSSEDYIAQSSSSTAKLSTQNGCKPSFRNSFSLVCQTDSSSSHKPNVFSNFKIPAPSVKTVVDQKSATDKNQTLPVKSKHKYLHVCYKDPSSSKTPAAATSRERKKSRIKITNVCPAQQRKILKESTMVPPMPPPVRLNFKIPKKTVVAETLVKDHTTHPTQSIQTPSTLEPAPSLAEQSLHASRSVTISPNENVQKQDPWPSSVNSFAPHADTTPRQDQLAEELHQARSENLLVVDVMQSYGELTCMEIDPPEEGVIDTTCRQQPEQDIIIVLDTNILLSHLDYVKKIVFSGLKAVSLSVVLIPWVVLQELDSLKKGRGLSGSVAHMAIPAISFIYKSLKGKERRLWAQSMQQAAASSKGLNAESNDDRVLQCCLQFQHLYPECNVILCTNDKNLCCKALVSGVKAFSKNDLEAEVASCSLGIFLVQASTTPAQALHSISTEATGISVEKGNNQLSDARRRSWHLESLVGEFESCLQEALSDVLEAEMKAAYDDLWLEIVYRKPPWSLCDVLHCMKKHWIAVFGQVIQRAKQKNVLNLIKFFTSGKSVDHNSTLEVLLEAKDLLKEFVKRSSCVPGAISVISNILNTLQTQGETSAHDVIMREEEEDKQVSHSGVWAHFVNIWEHVFQASLSVFKALDFDPTASASVQPAGSPPPPQDVLLCLDQLVCTVSQLLQAFSSVLTSPGLVEAQSLLSLMQSIQIVDVEKLTASDLLNCFSQEEYREKLRVGGNQLLEVKSALDRCVEFSGRHQPHNT